MLRSGAVLPDLIHLPQQIRKCLLCGRVLRFSISSGKFVNAYRAGAAVPARVYKYP